MALPVPVAGGFGSLSSSLKEKQRQAVLRLLNFNSVDNGSRAGQVGEWSDQWKVLVYDKPCRNIISTLMHVTQLRKQGVTLHMLLETEREAIPDVPAVYFCRPTEENMRRIAADAGKRLYSNLYINLSSKLERPLMELLARETLAKGSVDMISKIYDQNLEFVSLEQRLFSLDRPGSYVQYNDPRQSDHVEAYMKSMASALFGVLATAGGVPIIRALPGGPAQMMSELLSKQISDHLMGGGTAFKAAGAAGFQRPVVVVMHRGMDLVSALRHNSTYQALVDDVLDHRLNRVTVQMDAKNGQGNKSKTYDVDAENDSFYRRFKGSTFPEAIEANGSELAAVTQKEEDIRRRTSAAGINADAASAGLGVSGLGGAAGGGGDETTQELAAAVESLPKLLDQKKGLEMHTNILKAIMDVVAAREVPVYFEVEEEIISAPTKASICTRCHYRLQRSKARVQELLVSGKGSIRDKLRLLGVYCLAARPSGTEVAELEGLLRESVSTSGEAGAAQEVERGLGAVGYLRQQVSLQHLPTMQAGGTSGDSPRSGPKMLSGLLAKAQNQATGLLAKAAATAGQLLSRAKNTHATRVVESLLDYGEEDEAYLYLDPKLGERADPAAARARGPPREVIVFMIGGGCYSEYQNLQDFALRRSQSSPLSVTYGSTELVNAEKFFEQLMELGQTPG
ncbi:unnamed protein product [Sphacelaria rigidula]